ncbi:hypothetical protein [Hansschlegelia sp. KR7-227]|uniref:hypothetical protein n=1 Tax=Hansschlegelia sp. KR7-227 TaxID=3400914 RepID=UPI003C11D3A6
MSLGRITIGRIACAVAAGLGLAASGAAEAADYRGTRAQVVATHGQGSALNRGYSGRLPSCADPRVHGTIAGYFARREREYWGSSLELTAFTRPTELGYASWGGEFIPRRFCSAHTVTTDGRRRQIYWVIAEGMAPGSVGPGFDWCVTGLDRHYAFAPDCKMARP